MKETVREQAPRPSAREEGARADQPARADNVAAIVSYFESGIKPGAKAFGIELEHTIVTEDGAAVSYAQDHGVAWILEQLRADYPVQLRDADGDLIGVAREREAVTLEPAAQLELSAGPFTDLDDARATFDAFEARLARILEPQGMRISTLGYHPTARVMDLELIPKRRYKFMNLYLGEKSAWGPRMMRGSASTQISIDYTSEADCVRKLRLAYCLVPILALITDNTPYFEGQARPHELMRTEIWRRCDPDRCGIVPGAADLPSGAAGGEGEGEKGAFSWERYAEYLLDVPAILAPCSKNEWCYTERTFGELYATSPMQRADVEHALSMLFNDVRLKTYIELRPADAMPIPYVIAYAALVKGLFAREETLAKLETLFRDVEAADIEDAKTALMEVGFRARVYGAAAAEIADEVVRIAKGGLSPEEQAHLAPLAALVARRATLADGADGAR